MIPDTHNGGYLGSRRTAIPTACSIPDVQDGFVWSSSIYWMYYSKSLWEVCESRSILETVITPCVYAEKIRVKD